MLASIRRRCPWLPAALLLGAALAVVPAALAGIPNPAYSGKAKVGKVKPADWVGHWFQWFYATPEGYHPLYDTAGDYAGIGQRGPVWFLTPGLAQDDITRDIRVPAGVALFFPLRYSEFDNAGRLPINYLTTADLYSVVQGDVDLMDSSELFCVVDEGTGSEYTLADIAKRRIKSTVFSYGVGPDTLPLFFPEPTPVLGEMVNPAVADGYWVMLRPMTVGAHTVRYGRASGDVDVDWTLTYNITVVAVQQ